MIDLVKNKNISIAMNKHDRNHDDTESEPSVSKRCLEFYDSTLGILWRYDSYDHNIPLCKSNKRRELITKEKTQTLLNLMSPK